ncbi:MAG: phage holin family protein [Synergistaceae bacterium]|nr:phage holin family protein [Synergistaceae bacterium]
MDITDSADWIVGLLGAALGWFFGEFDGFLRALIVFTIVDYISGVIAAYVQKELSSAVGFKGILKKIMLFALVGVVNVLDREFLGNSDALRTAVVCFYLANEGVSILENAVKIGLPVPDILKEKLQQLHGKSDTEPDATLRKNKVKGKNK